VLGALKRLAGNVPHVDGLPVIVMSCVAALTMFVGAVILVGDDAGGPASADDEADTGQNLAMRGVLLDTMADATIALGVALPGAIIMVTGGLFWLDPVVAIGVSVVVAYHAVKLLRDVAAHIGTTLGFRDARMFSVQGRPFFECRLG
jgi:cobalt-zinc-cadmium efflux system protein